MSKVLISGATGFIGEHLTKTCLDIGHEVYITKGIKPENKPRVNGRHFLDSYFQDLDWDEIDVPETLFHLASCTDTMIHDEHYMLKVNHDDALAFMTNAIEHGVKRIVYASSAAVYGKYETRPFREDMECKPLNIYGESKARLDESCRRLSEKHPDVTLIGLRYSNVYGGKNEAHKGKTASMVWQMYQSMKHAAPTLFKWGEQARDFVHVSDVVQANLLAASASHDRSGVYNVGAGRMWSFNQIAEIVNQLHGTSWKTKYIDNPIKQYYQNYNPVEIGLAKSRLGYRPKYNLDDGLNEIHSESLAAANPPTTSPKTAPMTVPVNS